MISVIIPKEEEDFYLIRCLNSIKRQTYKDTEILLIDRNCEQDIIDKYSLKIVETDEIECSGLNKAIAQSEGEYIYFCSSSTVLAPDTFEKFLSGYEEEDTGEDGQADTEQDVSENGKKAKVLVYANINVMSGNNFEEKDMQMSCYGKLFDRSILIEKEIEFAGNNFFTEKIFLMEYMSCFDTLVNRKNIYIYTNDYKPLFDETCIDVDVAYWRNLFKAMMNTTNEVSEKLQKFVVNVIKEKGICSQDVAMVAHEEWSSNYELNYVCMAPVLKFLWSDAMTNRNIDSFKTFKEYMTRYEDEDILDLFLKNCGLNDHDYDLIKKNDNVKQCLFLIEQNDILSKEQSAIENAVRDIIANQGGGLVKINNKWYYYKDGNQDKSYKGLVRNKYGWWYVSDGTINKKYKGLSENDYGIWYISNGTVDRSYTGLAMNENGIWMYVENGKVNKKYTGLTKCNSGYIYIFNGVIDTTFSGLLKTEEGKWVYIENGKINKAFIGLAKNDYGWWYVEDGTINFSYNGFAKNNLGWCRVRNGKAVPGEETDIIKIMDTPELLKEYEAERKEEVSDKTEDVSEITVGYYSKGQLGIGTIMKSMGAWAKYKFKR